MQSYLQTTYRDLQKNEKKLQIFQRQPLSQKPVLHLPFKSPEKRLQPPKPSLPTNNFNEISEKLKEIQLKNQQAIFNKRNSSPNPRDIKKTMKVLKISLPKENGFLLKVSHPSDLFLRRKFQTKPNEMKDIMKKKDFQENLREKELKKPESISDSTNYTEKEEGPRDLKVISLNLENFKKKVGKGEFWRTFPKDLRFFSPFHDRLPEWKASSIENQYEKLNDLMEKTKKARNNLLDIQLSIFDYVLKEDGKKMEN